MLKKKHYSLQGSKQTSRTQYGGSSDNDKYKN